MSATTRLRGGLHDKKTNLPLSEQVADPAGSVLLAEQTQ
jgi:hypothetical protein